MRTEREHPFLILTQPEAIKADAKTLLEQLLDGPRKPLVLTGESSFCLFVWGFVFHPKYNREKGMTLAGLIGEKAIAKVGQATELSGAFCGIDD